tara:strand:+ start:1142 stop:1462 length:321 start_codon:yes stop_codon:yes gene_type:complete
MGKKARNAGTKKSKTCDKLATAKSVNPNGKIGRVSKKTTYYMGDEEIFEMEKTTKSQGRIFRMSRNYDKQNLDLQESNKIKGYEKHLFKIGDEEGVPLSQMSPRLM